MKFCAKCGTATVAGNRFCKGCGAAIQAPPAAASIPDPAPVRLPVADTAPATNASKQCPLCARSYPASQKFCNVDGAALGVAAFDAPSPPLAREEAATSEEAQAPAPPTDAPLANQPLPEPEPAPLPAEAIAQLAVADPSKPATAPVQVAADQQPANEDLACPRCGLFFPSGVRFCDRDGAVLVSKAEAEAALTLAVQTPPVPPDEPAWDSDWNGGIETRKNRTFLIASLAVLAALLAAGGYAYWSGMLNAWLGENSDAKLVAGPTDPANPSALAGDTDLPAPLVPGLQGTYQAHLSDQDISLTIAGNDAQPLATSAGTIAYVNVVTGATCTASLIALSGGGVGGVADNAVSFRQAPVQNKPACPKDIPVKMDISDQPADANRIAQSIKVEWLSPDSARVLMSGVLARAGSQ